MGLLGIMKQKNLATMPTGPKLGAIKPMNLAMPQAEPIAPEGLLKRKNFAQSTEVKPMPGLLKRLTGK